MSLLLVCPINKGNVLHTCKIDKVGNTKAYSLTHLILSLILTCTHNNFYLHVMCFRILKFVILHVRNTLTLFSVNARGRRKCCSMMSHFTVLFNLIFISLKATIHTL